MLRAISSLPKWLPIAKFGALTLIRRWGLNDPPVQKAAKRSLLLQLNLFNLPNPLHVDSARWRECSPLSVALEYSNSCVMRYQSPERDHGLSRGKIWIYLTI